MSVEFKILDYMDKLGRFGEGPWVGEADRYEWIDPESNIDCLITRNRDFGTLCGYVAVPQGHPLFGYSYGENIPGLDKSPEEILDAHGGITYSGPCMEERAGEPDAVCHIPAPGRPESVWWFGFDCSHAWDFNPGLAVLMAALRPRSSGKVISISEALTGHAEVYRDVEYVQAECNILARQLAAINNKVRLSAVTVDSHSLTVLADHYPEGVSVAD